MLISWISWVRARFPHTEQQVSEICGYSHPKHDLRSCASLIYGHHTNCNIMLILQWCRIIFVVCDVLSRQMKAFCVHCKCWEFLWVAVCQISIIIASNAHRLLRVDDSNDFITFSEIPDIFLRIFKLQWRLCSLYWQNELMYFTDFQLCIFREAQHNKNIALFQHIQIMRHMQCFALGSVGFQPNQADSTAQCILQFSVA